MKTNTQQSWDIFCRVVDNYGDIGVCWRLAKQLAHEHSKKVRLWVDDLAALRQIYPATKIVSQQFLEKVNVNQWLPTTENATIADVVVEAFACQLPPGYLEKMHMQALENQACEWINLEYLSAEAWIESCHGLPSIQQQTNQHKTFFFPGFTEQTGGLIRESNLLAQRDEFLNNTKSQHKFLANIGLSKPSTGLLISLFSYENTSLKSLLTCWQSSSVEITCLVPSGKSLNNINAIIGQTLNTGDCLKIGQLTLLAIPFLSQHDYDHLLWLCDINFVRGEDSFIRAQWAAKPMVWHIYPQDEDSHLIKLEAFLQHYTNGVSLELKQAINTLWKTWNQGDLLPQQWNDLMKLYEQWGKFSAEWCQQLAIAPDLTKNLVDFVEKRY